jgi:hypothetical protein
LVRWEIATVAVTRFPARILACSQGEPIPTDDVEKDSGHKDCDVTGLYSELVECEHSQDASWKQQCHCCHKSNRVTVWAAGGETQRPEKLCHGKHSPEHFSVHTTSLPLNECNGLISSTVTGSGEACIFPGLGMQERGSWLMGIYNLAARTAREWQS